MTNTRKNRFTTRELTTIAILGAIAAVLFMIEIPVVLFYKLDLSSLPVLLGAFSMGPVPGTMILLVKAALGLLHSTSQGVGELADFIMGFAMLLPASLVYKRVKSRTNGASGVDHVIDKDDHLVVDGEVDGRAVKDGVLMLGRQVVAVEGNIQFSDIYGNIRK